MHFAAELIETHFNVWMEANREKLNEEMVKHLSNFLCGQKIRQAIRTRVKTYLEKRRLLVGRHLGVDRGVHRFLSSHGGPKLWFNKFGGVMRG